MMKRGWPALCVISMLLGSCGGDPCPDAYTEVDAHCVPEAIASQCHFDGSSGPGESCEATADCNGCFIVCMAPDRVCFEQLLGGSPCDRDVECRSQSCEANLCAQE